MEIEYILKSLWLILSYLICLDGAVSAKKLEIQMLFLFLTVLILGWEIINFHLFCDFFGKKRLSYCLSLMLRTDTALVSNVNTFMRNEETNKSEQRIILLFNGMILYYHVPFFYNMMFYKYLTIGACNVCMYHFILKLVVFLN